MPSMTDSLLNKDRPPVFCPGCAHERVVHALGQAFQELGLAAHEIALVSDIGCSGLFDTFFNTHALHGLHGRALTYATGIKMTRPKLNVVVTMGDGGLGIGGAHLLSACRRNLNLTLLVLNNFAFGMTGGQYSCTTGPQARVASGFLNQLEAPLDVCSLSAAAGAGYVKRVSAHGQGLARELAAAISHEGFAVLDIQGICPGRFTANNKLTPAMINEGLKAAPGPIRAPAAVGQKEYAAHYHKLAAAQPSPAPPQAMAPRFIPPSLERSEVLILGSAGQRIVTAGELLCLAGMSGGLFVTQKNDFPITVLRGHSVSEVILSGDEIGFTGITRPRAVLALSRDGVDRRRALLEALPGDALIICPRGLDLPFAGANIMQIDCKALGIKSADRALAALAILARTGSVITTPMLDAALEARFTGELLEKARDLAARAGGAA